MRAVPLRFRSDWRGGRLVEILVAHVWLLISRREKRLRERACVRHNRGTRSSGGMVLSYIYINFGNQVIFKDNVAVVISES
jgi:hypothetical protein